MLNTKLTLAYLAAIDTRHWAERYQKTSPGRYWEGCGGLCAIASAKLFKKLEFLGIDAKIVINNHHCFLLVDEHILDVTATQFTYNNARVTIIPNNKAQPYYWQQKEVFNSLEELLNYQNKADWPKHQQPTPEILELE